METVLFYQLLGELYYKHRRAELGWEQEYQSLQQEIEMLKGENIELRKTNALLGKRVGDTTPPIGPDGLSS